MSSGSDEHERAPGQQPERPDDDGDPAEQLKQGLGLLFRAAKGIAHVASESVRTEVDKAKAGAGGAAGTLLHALDDAGRELARAAGNVATKLSRIAEPEGAHDGSGDGADAPARGAAPHEPPREGADQGSDPGAGAAPPAASGEREPGFRIQVDPPADDSKAR